VAFNGTIRRPEPDDFKAWEQLWQGYCDIYEESVPPVVTQNTWARLLGEDQSLFGLIAEDEGGRLIGFTNCVVHAGTWSKRDVCYLEDLFVADNSRGQGVGRALIEAVVAKSRAMGWQQVYWQTKVDNATARALYDAITPASDWVIYEVKT
jgi:GNAT superfamily N-acetyltransferase